MPFDFAIILSLLDFPVSARSFVCLCVSLYLIHSYRELDTYGEAIALRPQEASEEWLVI